MTPEQERLQETHGGNAAWRLWGPYLSERQWGTVREDYSASGDAWDYFTHDHARSRTYHWGEDGLAGISDNKQRLCFALALWNGQDAILKERLFGLTNSEGNHGEDVKEYYYYLDSTPTHSYMKYLYKYPQRAFPYSDLVETNRRRSRSELEYELIDTGIFGEDRYFDVVVEYAKETPDDVLIRITVHNRGPDAATLHVLPTLWFRNTWAWWPEDGKPELRALKQAGEIAVVAANHYDLGEYFLSCANPRNLLFTENDTNQERIFATPNSVPYVKDAFHNYLVQGKASAINPAKVGTKAAAHYTLQIGPGKAEVMRLRLGRERPAAGSFDERFDKALDMRRQEADAFYAAITPPSVDADGAAVMRQALAGMFWTKQYYFFDVETWLDEHGADPLLAMSRQGVRNREWFHMVNDDVISMPDKWEYPWYAAWDLAFHCVALSTVDLDFAKQQLDMMLRELYLHPNGQIPAYEWNFGAVNPPVHAWAAWWVYNQERNQRGKGDIDFLKQAFNKLILNFTWWVNLKDRTGRNVFEGGFLGLDNIGVFDRSAPLPTGGQLEQADGTAWMALYCQNMLQIALELAMHDSLYEDMALKFVEHFLWIAAAMNRQGPNHESMWDEEDGFFYDLLRLPDGKASRLKVRSMVGLLPFCAATVFPADVDKKFPRFLERVRKRIQQLPELQGIVPFIDKPGVANRGCLTMLDENKLRRVLAKLLDEKEFLSPYGIRSLSRYHAEHPYVLRVHGEDYRVDYLPAESNTGMFGGNTNWRGPIWFPVNLLVMRSLFHYYAYFGDSFKVECPTGSGQMMNLYEVTNELVSRLKRIFLRDERGQRPVFGGTKLFQNDPHWRDHVLFYEYFHGDNGAGLGASHQTGWTGAVAMLIQLFAVIKPETYLREHMGALHYPQASQ
ncbi:MAG TPA: glucosidase [Gemmataceae bacterium]|nr:glucosidase [Gemmataceae bacterium]